MGNTLAGLKKHADRYGPEGIAETGAELGLGLKELTDLIEHTDRVEQSRKPRLAQRHRKIDFHAVAEARAKRLLGIEDEPEAA